eukprot:TRINITY_DN541_c0_g1_i1.p1 TRINITY_DN541_c0_g1~~TRINITY_DN541_c0_g1_i1.p1  ORF type:complete len:355 (+),score=44.26 TRINITY_DN541_c0_g1_i1:168-1232(+)
MAVTIYFRSHSAETRNMPSHFLDSESYGGLMHHLNMLQSITLKIHNQCGYLRRKSIKKDRKNKAPHAKKKWRKKKENQVLDATSLDAMLVDAFNNYEDYHPSDQSTDQSHAPAPSLYPYTVTDPHHDFLLEDVIIDDPFMDPYTIEPSFRSDELPKSGYIVDAIPVLDDSLDQFQISYSDNSVADDALSDDSLMSVDPQTLESDLSDDPALAINSIHEVFCDDCPSVYLDYSNMAFSDYDRANPFEDTPGFKVANVLPLIEPLSVEQTKLTHFFVSAPELDAIFSFISSFTRVDVDPVDHYFKYYTTNCSQIDFQSDFYTLVFRLSQELGISLWNLFTWKSNVKLVRCRYGALI